jgi:hypothetical protein
MTRGSRLEGGAKLQHLARAAPGGVQQKHHELSAREFGGGQSPGRQVACGGTRVDEHGKISRFADDGLHRLIRIEADAHVHDAVGQAEMG